MYLSSKPMAPAGERTAGKHVPRAKPAFSSREEEGTWGKEVEDLNHSRLGGETAIGVHGHKKIKNFQKSSRAICCVLDEDCRARRLRGHGGAVQWEIIGPAGSGIRLTSVTIRPASCCLCDLKQILLCSP